MPTGEAVKRQRIEMRRRADTNKGTLYILLGSIKSGIAGNAQSVPVSWFESIEKGRAGFIHRKRRLMG